MRNFMDSSVVEHKSKPPLRWIANWAGSIASSGLLKISYMEDEGMTDTFRYKFHGWKWDTFWPIYQKYGTTYKMDMDLSGEAWDDYDENGIPYWEKTGTVDPFPYPEVTGTKEWAWRFVDPWTGDAFRVINPRVIHRVYPDGLKIPEHMMDPNVGDSFKPKVNNA